MSQRPLVGASRTHRGIIRQRQVNNPSLACTQRVHRLGPPGFAHVSGKTTGHIDQFSTSPLPVSFSVEHDSAEALVLVADEAIHQVFERIERLPVPTDQQTSSVARNSQANFSTLLAAGRIDPRAEAHELDKALQNLNCVLRDSAGVEGRRPYLGDGLLRCGDDCAWKNSHARSLRAEAEEATSSFLNDLYLGFVARDAE